MKLNNKNKGFTLVELIVVIVILGILAVIAVPKYMNMKIEAKNAVLEGLAASLRTAAAQYHAKVLTSGVSFPERPMTNVDSSLEFFFDPVTGFYYNELNGYGFSEARATCGALPNCTGLSLGYPNGGRAEFIDHILDDFPPTFVGIEKLINRDPSLSVHGGFGMAKTFYFTEDANKPNVKHHLFGGYMGADPCTVRYISPSNNNDETNQDLNTYAKWNDVTNDYDETGESFVNPGDGAAHVYVTPCTK